MAYLIAFIIVVGFAIISQVRLSKYNKQIKADMQAETEKIKKEVAELLESCNKGE